MTVDKSKTKYIRVQLLLDEDTRRMVEELVTMRSTEDHQHSYSSIVRRAIRQDYRQALQRLAAKKNDELLAEAV